jgi:ankyrin repeat protein
VDAKFHPAIAAIKAGDVDRLRALLGADASLATSRSTTSHPTLLQCLVLNGRDAPNQIEMARLLIDAGAEMNGPLCACGSCNNVAAATLLVDCGAAVDGTGGTGGWSPLEEALYWNSPGVIDLLVQRGASIHNLRIAAGLGRTDAMDAFFAADGGLLPEAGTINWPWGDLNVIEHSNCDRKGKDTLAAKFATFANDGQGIINNAFVYACMHGHVAAAQLLLGKGAGIDAIAGGFDYSGTALHYAALNGHKDMVEFLIARGADTSIKDTKVGQTPAGWADYGGHPDITALLERSR